MSTVGTHGTGRPVAAAVVWVASWALAIVAIVLGAVFGLPADPLPGLFLSEAPVEVRTLAIDIDLTVALVYGPVAALLLARRPSPVAAICALYAVGSALAAFGIQYGLLAAQVGGLPFHAMLAYTGGWAFVPGTFLVALVPLMISVRRPPRWQRVVVGVTVVVAAAATVINVTQSRIPGLPNPLGIPSPGYQAVLPPTYTALSMFTISVSLLSCVVVAVRWRRSRGGVRSGLGWLAAGQLFVTLSYFAQALPASLGLPRAVLDFALLTPVVGQLVYPAAILVVVLRHRLWGVELVVSRVLMWALLTASGAILYLLVVTIVPVTLSPGGGWTFVAPLVVALTVLPLRGWLQRRIDRLVYGEGADAASLLTRLSERIGELPPGPDGLASLADTLRRVLRLGHVRITAGDLDAASGRRRRADVVRVPLSPRDPGLGALEAQPRPGQRLDRRTRTVLEDVAGLVATVVRLARSFVRLERARADLAGLRARERRSIRRELHDGLGPALAGIGFGLAAVENLAAEPDRARALLAELAEDVRARAREVRELADTVAVSRLGGDDLAPELERLARRFHGPRLRVRVETEDALGLLPGQAEALALIAAEAVTNAARHAEATRVRIRLHRDTDGATVLRVSDDGRGIGPDAVAGVGMSSMRERAAGAGGALRIESDRTGTSVVARIPAVTGPARIEDPAP
ncbi:sensor histidine kinase [Microbacterium sp. GXF7504]